MPEDLEKNLTPEAPRVESEPLFAKLKSDAAYQEVLAKIRANPPEPERGGEFRRR